MSNNTGGPAFPCAGHESGMEYDRGMTLRDYFAAMAMQGMLANSSVDMRVDDLCAVSYEHADAMLAEREKE